MSCDTLIMGHKKLFLILLIDKIGTFVGMAGDSLYLLKLPNFFK